MRTNNTSAKPWLRPLLLGLLCAALTALASWYDLTYNGGKLVYPMNSYVFEPTDIPMIAALMLDVLYGVYLVCRLICSVSKQKREVQETNRTRRTSPKLGLLGFLGFFGFAGFWSYSALGDPTPLVFFAFFGLFGFFFQGKMSNVLMDERYKENAARAERTAYRTGFSIIFLLLVFAGQSNKFSAEITVMVLLAGIALSVALTIFLNEYLLYRYDHDDRLEPDMEDE